MISQILIVMIAAIAVTVIAERRGIQAPLLLAAVGLVASFIPGLPRLELEPEIILTVVVPPLLFAAATEFSFVSFLRRLGSIVNLGVFLVAVTTGVVGAVAAAIVPGLTLPVALVLGAVVSPPDAVTAVAVGRQMKLPASMMTVLKGESLINDAAALTFFTFAVASVAGTQLFISNLFLYLLYSAFAGFAIGLILGWAVHRVRLRVTSPALSTVLTVLVPFTAYILAEELGASGVLAVVAAGLQLGHHAREANYDARIQEREFWRSTDALLEAFVFAYIGLQLRWVITDALGKGHNVVELFALSLVVLLAAIAVRIAWVFFTGIFSRWWAGLVARRVADYERLEAKQTARPERRLEALRRYDQRRRGGRPSPQRDSRFARRMDQVREARREGGFDLMPAFSWQENLVISWTGMRGVVTLAAAAGIPLVTAAGAPFPGRDVIQVVAFVVTIGTLLIQGLTLPWLIRRLGISDAKEAARKAQQMALAETLGRDAMLEAVTTFRDGQTDPGVRGVADAVLTRMSARSASVELVDEAQTGAMKTMADEILKARRAAVVKARDDRRLDDEVMREVLEQLDLEQAAMANRDGRLPGA